MSSSNSSKSSDTAVTDTTAPLDSVAVIGGSGFLGHHIVRQLLDEPTVTSVAVMSRNPTANLVPGAVYRAGDITNQADVDCFIAEFNPNVVINTASPVAYTDHIHTPDYEKVNVGGNANLLAACKSAKSPVRAYVYTSSGPIIAGSGGAYTLADETHPTLAYLKPGESGKSDPYHLAKARGDALVLGANDSSPGGMRTATIRPTAMYGEGDRQMAPSLVNALREGNQTVWLGDNTALMDSVYVGSVARAHILAAQALVREFSEDESGVPAAETKTKQVAGEAFNITDDAPFQPWNFFRLFWIAMGDTTPLSRVWIIPSWLALLMAEIAEWWTWTFSFGRLRPKVLVRERIEFLVYTRTYDISKARERLGYTPMLDTGEAVRRAVQWAMGEWPDVNLLGDKVKGM